MSTDAVAALVAVLTAVAAFVGGLWKIAAQVSKVQTTIDYVVKDLEKNTKLTEQTRDEVDGVSKRVATLEGAAHQRHIDRGRFAFISKDRDK